MQGQPRLRGQRLPVRFGLHTQFAPPRGRRKRRIFVDPTPLMIAIDPSGRQVSDPFKLRGEGYDFVSNPAQNGVAVPIWPGRDQKMRRLR